MLSPSDTVIAAQMADSWLQSTLCPRPIDKIERELALQKLYEALGLPLPVIVECASPRELARQLQGISHLSTQTVMPSERLKRYIISAEFDLRDHLTFGSLVNLVHAKFDGWAVSELLDAHIRQVFPTYGGYCYSGYINMYDIVPRLLAMDILKQLNIPVHYDSVTESLALLIRFTPIFVPLRRLCIAVKPPITLAMDQKNRIHSTVGPAIEYQDGSKIYAYKNIPVPAYAIQRPESLRIEQIEGERNAEKRRALLELFGPERLIKESHMTLVDEDKNSMGLFRQLLRRQRYDEPTQNYLHLINCAKEPDGSRKPYIFKVPPQINTVQEALNWHRNLPPNFPLDYTVEA